MTARPPATATAGAPPKTPPQADLSVDKVSDALCGWSVDVVVSGSIGAVESVRFIRALRRLGAEVHPWLTRGGAQFVTETALAWAAGRPVRTAFSGDASHVATADACVVTPASASMVGRIALGLTSTPAAALVASHLGYKRPVLILPNMHGSLAASPAVKNNLAASERLGAKLVGSRDEEGKRKFPEPRVLADEIAHSLNASRMANSGKAPATVLVTMGTTRGPIDDVRYVSNYSSGALGTQVVEELYRRGFDVDVVCGPCPVRPSVATRLTQVVTNEEMGKAAADSLAKGASAAVLAASVLDFVPETKTSGKIPTATNERLTLHLKRTPKLIAQLNPKSGVKVGFKLETDLTEARATELAARYGKDYGLSLFVINDLADVDAKRHRARLFELGGPATAQAAKVVDGKAGVAHAIVDHLARRLGES